MSWIYDYDPKDVEDWSIFDARVPAPQPHVHMFKLVSSAQHYNDLHIFECRCGVRHCIRDIGLPAYYRWRRYNVV